MGRGGSDICAEGNKMPKKTDEQTKKQDKKGYPGGWTLVSKAWFLCDGGGYPPKGCGSWCG